MRERIFFYDARLSEFSYICTVPTSCVTAQGWGEIFLLLGRIRGSRFLNPKPVVGDQDLREVILSKDRIFETGFIALGVMSTALAVWLILSI